MAPDPESALVVTGARTHNLKNVSCAIPHARLTVVTGPSGAGKSSLVFDTLYAEGQRRFAESLSTYAQQFVQQMERPPVEAIDGLPPAIALEAKNAVRNARSTVGTLTEVDDLLRLVFTHLGEIECPRGHGTVRRWSRDEIAAALAGGLVGDAFVLTVPLPRPARRADEVLAEVLRQGYFRVWGGGELVRLETGAEWPAADDPLELVIGRYRHGDEAAAKVLAGLDEAFRLGPGEVIARGAEVRRFGRELACIVCGEAATLPVPPLFSFNSPLGACPTCSGFGRVIGIDPRRVVPDPSRSLAERPIAAWNTPSYEGYYDELLAACRRRGVPVDVPWSELAEETRQWIWRGERDFVGLDPFFQWLEDRKYKVHVRVLLSRYRSYHRCPDCGGARLQPEALRVKLRGATLPELVALPIERFRGWLGEQCWRPGELARGGHLLERLGERLAILERVGVGYLGLDRAARTLSGGESQRLHLATALGSGLTGTLYCLDEPTVGLHASDSRRLLGLLRDLAARGNTVVVVEHDPVLIAGADRVIELGPQAGEAGGEVLFSGTFDGLVAHGGTATARALARSRVTLARRHLARRRQEKGWRSVEEALERRPRVTVRGARAHNLRDLEVSFPLGALVAVVGVSGSGKSTLVEGVLWEGWRAARGEAGAEPGEHDALEGLDRVDEVLMLDQRPLGRSTRSMPVTVVGAWDELRKLFAATAAARQSGLTPGHFSFNVAKGRCPACQGSGEQEVDLHFLGDVTVVCETCQGKRFRPLVLEVRLRGRTVAETLELTVAEALEVFADATALHRKLRLLEAAGLGYLRLGQPTSTLSVGEAQRLRLATFLRRGRKAPPRLLLFDEPTTGLHLSDIALLYRSLRRLVQQGDGVLVVEHQLDLIGRADWIVELGPGGGERGGRLLFSGPAGRFLDEVDSPTADELRRHLGWERRRRLAGVTGDAAVAEPVA